ncbi:MAG: periplasmic heavy metal sensor [Chitinivibrionales bacterium]|nr:periplasmic heavy metal sensor [Chitinivibrionales bacterium]
MKQRTLSLITLAALAMTLFAGTALARGPHHGKNCEGSPRILEIIPDLTDNQKAEIETLIEQKRSAMKDERKKGLKLMIELKKLVEDDVAEPKVHAKIDQIAEHRATGMKKRYAHHREIAKVLTEEQREYLKELGPGFMMHKFGCGRKGHGQMHGW